MRVVQILLVASYWLSACAMEPDAEASRASPADQILDAAARVTGAAEYAEQLHVLAEATVTGPGDSFRTLIHSSSDGRVRMEQTPFGFLAGVGEAGGWLQDPATGEVGELGGAASFVLGHELHMLALHPLSRLSSPRIAVPSAEDPAGALGITFSLPSEDSLVVYYSAADTIPIGLRVAYTDPNVVVSWSDWVERRGLQLFGEALFRQGQDVFSYTYDRVEVGTLPDSIFEPPGS